MCPDSNCRSSGGNRPGFALPLLIVILAIGTIGALMASSVAMQQLQNSRSLDNSVRSLLAAESGAAFMVNAFTSGLYELGTGGPYTGADLAPWGGAEPRPHPDPDGRDSWSLSSITFQGQTVTMRIIGEDGSLGARREIEVEFTLDVQSASPFAVAVVGCSGATIKGSGMIDSYNSLEGTYQQTAGANASVHVIDGDIDISGGSSDIKGNIHVGGNVTHKDSNITGSVIATGNVTVESGNGKILGEVHAGGNYTTSASNWGGVVKAVGDITVNGWPTCPKNDLIAGGKTTYPAWWCTGPGQLDYFKPGSNVSTPPKPGGECDPLDIAARNAELKKTPYKGVVDTRTFSNGQAPTDIVTNTHFTNGLTADGSPDNWVNIHAGAVDQIFIDGKFSIGGSAKVRIVAPASGQGARLRIFVDGEIDLGGSGEFIIDEGVAVEIYVTEKTTIGGSIKNRNPAPATTVVENGVANVVPSLIIYSSYEGPGGVTVGGHTDIFSSVYAPLTDVSMEGSGALYGAVRGKKVSVSGGGARIHYDEALGKVQEISGGNSGNVRITRWTDAIP